MQGPDVLATGGGLSHQVDTLFFKNGAGRQVVGDANGHEGYAASMVRAMRALKSASLFTLGTALIGIA